MIQVATIQEAERHHRQISNLNAIGGAWPNLILSFSLAIPAAMAIGSATAASFVVSVIALWITACVGLEWSLGKVETWQRREPGTLGSTQIVFWGVSVMVSCVSHFAFASALGHFSLISEGGGMSRTVSDVTRSGVIFGLLFARTVIGNGLHRPKFPPIVQPRLRRAMSSAPETVVRAVRFAAIPAALVVPVVVFFGDFLCGSVSGVVLGEPSCDKGLGLWRTWLMVAIIEVAISAIFHFVALFHRIVNTEYIEFRDFGMEGDEKLDLMIGAIDSNDPVVRRAGFYDLFMVASSSSPLSRMRRGIIFNDRSMAIWKHVSGQCFSQIEQLILKLRAEVLKMRPFQASPFAHQQQQQVVGFVPRIQMAIGNIVMAIRLTAALRIREAIQLVIPRRSIQARAVSDIEIEDLQVHIWAIQAISSLVAASKTEDRYGAAQLSDSIGNAFGHLAECFFAADELHKNTKVQGLGTFVESFTSGVVISDIFTLREEIFNSIFRMRVAFGNTLSVIPIHPRYHEFLENFRLFTC